ncbi:MAG TPA: MBL fold metallo-hydrolase [Acidobacteriota bacterium]|nr:MBL fold metallo-hydrolase [Acidobacteriota bacterium]
MVFLITPLYAADYGKVETQKVADGVYLFRTSPYGDVGMSGNCIAILTNESVVIFDSSATPQTASNILDEIKKLTDRPVGYMINSHWHWDHWGGNEVFLAAFPKLQIISHEKTLEQLKTVEPRWNDEGLKAGLPQYLSDLEKQVEKSKADQIDPTKLKSMEELLAADKNFLQQKTSLKRTYPNKTFTDQMTIQPGGRKIQILHARAITVGDAYLYLPKERILITGDILLSPFPFAIGGSYPADWLNTLKGFAALKPSVVIPGHGDAQTAEFINQNIAMFEKVIRLVKTAKSHRLTLEQTKELAAKQKAEIAQPLGLNDPQTLADFKAYFLDVFVTRAYRELDQPLSDLPDGLREN